MRVRIRVRVRVQLALTLTLNLGRLVRLTLELGTEVGAVRREHLVKGRARARVRVRVRVMGAVRRDFLPP